MLENEGLWKRVAEGAVPGEGSASWEVRCSVLLFIIRVVVLYNVCVQDILIICVLLQFVALRRWTCWWRQRRELQPT